MSAVSGTTWSRAFPLPAFLPFILAAGMVQSFLRQIDLGP